MQYNNGQYYQQPGYQPYQVPYQGGQPYYQQQQPYAAQQPNMAQYGASPAVPFPTTFASPPAQPTPIQPSRPARTHTPHPHRRHTNAGATSNGQQRPLRSAMKKVERAHTTAVPLARTRTHSGGENRSRLNSIARTRTSSSSGHAKPPDHLFVTIEPPNELILYNIAYPYTIDEIKERLFPMWQPGISHQETWGSNWRVKFAGSPWNLKGSDSIMVHRMMIQLFWVLVNQGYVYLTTIQAGRALKSPRLVFIRSLPDPGAHFFAMSFNSAGDRLTFVNAPDGLALNLGLYLRSTFPRRIEHDEQVLDGVFHLSLKKSDESAGRRQKSFPRPCPEALQ
ncbi:hypothetical protein EW146_g28 [Bondarzewia mesenterica]|uniref:Uncharacterized protein n=1 Tax=Bondarzewia mesenterica TaxID=1095465 RepID=A0A4S4M852_9AGAM|nr:hypothetical protein EW146_g28 [Bondarzewia mesenterica]